MLAFPSMLCSAADQAGIKYPDGPEVADYDPAEFPHWHVLCATQLARSCQPGEHFENAVIIGAIDVSKLKKMTFNDFAALGVYPS